LKERKLELLRRKLLAVMRHADELARHLDALVGLAQEVGFVAGVAGFLWCWRVA
jgi:hypothetical protein